MFETIEHTEPTRSVKDGGPRGVWLGQDECLRQSPGKDSCAIAQDRRSLLDDFGLVCVNFPCSCSHRMHRNKLRFKWTPLKADIGYQRPYTKQKKASRREDGANPEGRTSVTPVHHRLQFCRMVIFVFCLGCTALVALIKLEYVYLDLSSSFCMKYTSFSILLLQQYYDVKKRKKVMYSSLSL